MYYKVKFIELDGTIQNFCTNHKKEMQNWLDKNDVVIKKVIKITKKCGTDVTKSFNIKNLQEETKEKKYIDTDEVSIMTKNYIHENELEFMVTRLWEELYNHEPFTPYDENYLKSVYTDLFSFDREDSWLINQILLIDYDLWLKAYNEHYLIINLIGKICAYIGEPFDYIDNLYKPYTNKEKMNYSKKWGVK